MAALTKFCVAVMLGLFAIPSFASETPFRDTAKGISSSVQVGHTLVCNLLLIKSYKEKWPAFEAIYNMDHKFIMKKLADHNKNLKDDKDFSVHMKGQMIEAAACHPLASDLVGFLPGSNYLALVDWVATPFATIDRKITYSIWAYNVLYKSLTRYIDEVQPNFHRLNDRQKADLATAQRLLAYIRDILSLEKYLGKAPSSNQDAESNPDVESNPDFDTKDSTGSEEKKLLENIKKLLIKIPLPDSLPRPMTPSEVITKMPVPGSLPRPITPSEVFGSGLDLDEVIQSLNKTEQDIVLYEKNSRQSGSQVSSSTGSLLRPMIPVYALIDRELIMYEIEAVHLLFPSAIVQGQSCYERYVPDFPVFARLINTGRAIKTATAMLSAIEAAEILKFFNSAAGVQAQSFLLSDLSAVAVNDASSAKSLTSCLNLVPKIDTSSVLKSENWAHGTAVSFNADNKVWQTLMMMLAAQRIMVENQD